MYAHTCVLLHRTPNSTHVSENASETQIDTTMTFTVLIISIEQNEEFQESRVHYTLAGIQSLLKIGGWVPWHERGGPGNPGTLPWLRPCSCKRLQVFRGRIVKGTTLPSPPLKITGQSLPGEATIRPAPAECDQAIAISFSR